MENKDINHYRHLLDQQKEHHAEILDDMENVTIGENDNNFTSELSNYDNHPADGGSDLFDVEHQMGLKKLEATEVDEIERAKEKIVSGTYGLCESCKNPIDPKRLEILPQAKLCIDCARELDDHVMEMKLDAKKRRPPEEQVMLSMNINDSARAEQFLDAIEYGSSDTLQDAEGGVIESRNRLKVTK